jgi:hypothetical protein
MVSPVIGQNPVSLSRGSRKVSAFLGWGRPLYDEDLAQQILLDRGVVAPSRDLARRIRTQTLIIRILSVFAALLIAAAVVKELLP